MIPIPESIWREANGKRSRAPIWYKLLKNPLAIDKRGLFKEYMRAFNDVSDVEHYEKPNKYNFKLTGVK